MNFAIYPSLTLDSGTGLRLKGMCDALESLGHRCALPGYSKRRVRDPDFVFASKALPNACLAALSRRSKRTRAILDFDDLEWSYWEENWFMKNAMRASERVFTPRFDLYSVHTEPLRRYLEDTYSVSHQKTLFFGQGIHYRMFKEVRPKKRSQTVVYAAHLGAASRDIVSLFEVFARVARDRPDARLLVIGDGMFAPYYKKRAAALSDQISFSGYVPHREIPLRFSDAALAVNYMADTLANRYRSSIKVREYLAAGLPVVCNTIGDVSLFKDYVHAFPTGDFGAFERTLSRALDKPDFARARRGRAHVQKHWDWPVVARRFVKELEAAS